MSTPYRTAPGPLGARVNLSAFVREMAARTAREEKFGWVGTLKAPSTYQQLRGAYQHSQRTGEPLPVSNEFCASTIYIEPGDNVCFRFWHDVTHCRLGLSFSLEDELELALWHLDQMTREGLGPGTREHELLRVDLLGQIYLLGLIGRFPFDQGEFTKTCAELGLDAGILHELRRIVPPGGSAA